MGMTLIASLLGALGGAVLIGGVILLVFRLTGMDVPRFAVLWKAAFFAQAAVIVADTFGAPLLPGAAGALVVLLVGLIGAFIAYDRILETPEGRPMGRKAAALALGTHAVFSILSFLLILPPLLRAFGIAA
jgi:hypothetical protein